MPTHRIVCCPIRSATTMRSKPTAAIRPVTASGTGCQPDASVDTHPSYLRGSAALPNTIHPAGPDSTLRSSYSTSGTGERRSWPDRRVGGLPHNRTVRADASNGYEAAVVP
jgi:hypothetical protein